MDNSIIYLNYIKEINFNIYPIKYFRSKQLIFTPGKLPANIYYIETGYIKVYRITSNGLEIVFTILKPESFIPLLMVLGNSKNDFYFEALTDCRARILTFEQFRQLVKLYPQMHSLLVERLIKGYSNLVERLEMLNTNDALTRVATAILYLNNVFGQVEENKIIFPVKFSHELISGLAFTTRETASRKIEELNSQKIISTGYSNMQINDLEGLKKIAQ